MAASVQPKYPTQEHKNRNNLNLLQEKSEEFLLVVFHQHYPRNENDLYKALSSPREKGILEKLKKKKVLKDDQYNLIYPSTKKTDSTKFDVTLTFLLIRSLCGYKEPATGWDNEPVLTDSSVIADCIRLKLARNKINHGPTQVSTPEYKALYNRIKAPLVSLSKIPLIASL